MANSCGLKSIPSFSKEYIALVKTLRNKTGVKEIKEEYLDGLRKLKSKYSTYINTEDFFDYIQQIIDNSADIFNYISRNEDLDKVLSLDYSKELSVFDPNFVESTIDDQSKFDNLDSTVQEKNEKNAIADSIIAQYFPMASDARLAFEHRFKYNLIQKFFYNDADPLLPRINLSNEDMDKSVKTYREDLFKYLDTYVKKYFPQSYNGYSHRLPERKLEFFQSIINSPAFNISSIELIKIPVIETLQDQELKDKLNAYMAYIALNNFDSLIQQTFGDSIKVLYKENYKTDNLKYKINLGNNNGQGWSDQNADVDSTEEIGGVIRLFMESLNMYNTDGKILPFKMTFSDVKSGLGSIMNLFSMELPEKSSGFQLFRNIELSSYFSVDLKKDLEDAGLNNLYKEDWDSVYENYIQGKTFGQLLAQTKRSPSYLMPLLFTLLAVKSDIIFNNRYQEKQAVYSLWENLFNINNKNSLLNRTINSNGINIDSADLYSFVSSLFVNIENVPVIEYRKNEDKTSLIGLRQNTSNSKLNSQKYTWEAKYNVKFPQQFQTFTIDDFNKGTSTIVRLKNTDLLIHLSPSGTKITTVNNKPIVLQNITQEIGDFLSEVLGITIDQNFYENIYVPVGGNLKDLIDIIGEILYNYKVGKTIKNFIDNKSSSLISDREIYDENIKQFYGENVPNMMRGSMQPELIGKSLYPKIRTFSLALDIQQGYSKETTGKDGSRKQISLLGLSSLDSKYHELMYNHNLGDQDSILTGFNIYSSLEQVEYMRDYAGIEEKKQAVQFSEEEFLYANFLYDFYGGQVSIAENGTFSDLRDEKANPSEPTKFRIMGPVISDKPKLPKLRFDWRNIVTLPDGTKKRYLDLTVDDIYSIQQKEFGDYYQKVYNRIHQDLNNIQPYISKVINNIRQKSNLLANPIVVSLDYDNDYKEFNSICHLYNITPEDLIHQAVVEYQKEAREKGWNDNSIKLIKGVHYLVSKSGNFHNNPALFHQLSIYGIDIPFSIQQEKGYLPNLNTNTIKESSREARERVNLQLLSELLQNDIVLSTKNSSDTQDSAQWAAEKFNPEVYTTINGTQIFSEEQSWRKKNTIFLAKIFQGNNFVSNLTSLRSFQNWSDYKDFVELLEQTGNFEEKYDVTSQKFELQKTLQAIELQRKYNIFNFKEIKDYLLSQYIAERKGKSKKIKDILLEEYQQRFPNWKPETVERKIQERISTMSEEDIINKQAQYQLNKDINKALFNELKTGKPSEFYKRNLNKVVEYLNSQKENIEEERFNKIQDRINNPIKYSIQLNPEIERYQALNNWLGEAFQLTSVGTFIAHPGDNNATTIFNYEARMFGQQVKRNVSHSAELHREAQNSLKGIRQSARIAILTDAFDSYITFKGDYDKKGVETHNGATFYNGTMVDLDNNSLGADAMGQDKKSFLHAIDPKTGIAIIIKTAGFAVANSYIQGSPVFASLNRKMNDTIKWTDTLRKHGFNENFFNWLEDFNKNKLQISPIYIYRNGYWYKRSDFQINSQTGETSFLEELVSNKGDVLNNASNGRKSAGIINSNWQLWNLFGGAYSGHKDSKGNLSYINDEGSFKAVNYVMNHTGRAKTSSSLKLDQNNVIQIVKESQIDMMPTTEAVKFGPANINDVNKIIEDDTYSPTYMEVFTDNFGEQLDAEHSAEGGHVSLMTQVVNALGARGYSTSEAEECYRALELLAEQSFEEAFDQLSRLSNNDSLEIREKFKTAIANIMLSSIKNTSISDGNILSAIAQGLKRFQKFGNFEEIEGNFPISSPQIYDNLFSKLASTLEKAAVRLKFDGGMLVLNPSNGIHKIINGKLLGNITKEEVKTLQADSWNNGLQSSSQIQFGKQYFIITNEGDYEPKLIDSIQDFYEVKKQLESGAHIVEAFYDKLSVVEENGTLVPDFNKDFTPIGRDLATYGCVIKESNSDRTFSLWETDVIKHLFSWNDDTKTFDIINKKDIPKTLLEILWNRFSINGSEEVTETLLNDLRIAGINQNQIEQLSNYATIEEALLAELKRFGIDEINPDLMHAYLERSFQNVLNSISQSGIRRSVIINGESIKIDNNGTTVSPYEAIAPMIYKTTFGLQEGDTLGEIEKDKYFFVRRFIENSKSKVSEEDFDIELKRISGEHIYLAYPGRMIDGVPQAIQTEIYGEVLYRVDPETGKRLYQIPSKINEKTGQLEADCVIYKQSNGVEIIQTKDFLTFLNQDNYTSIYFGDLDYYNPNPDYENPNIQLYQSEEIKDILTQLEQSTNEVAENKIKYVLNAINEKVKRNAQGIIEGDSTYTLAIPSELQTYFQLEYDNTPFTSISEIFDNSDKGNSGLNALQNHKLYINDAQDEQKLLDTLKLKLNNEAQLKEFLAQNPRMKRIVDFGLVQHTSFLASLEAVVSRTPAQSHQSFMAMKIAGFDSNTTNSIFVSRMQLFLQGSDFDIDKANLLGLKFNNGKLVIWSPYFDLSSRERSIESEYLPFPSGRSLELQDDTNRIPWDVIDKKYQKVEIENGYAFIDNNGNIIKATTLDDGLSYNLEYIPNQEGKNTNTYLLQHAIIKNFGDKIINSNGVLDQSVFNFTDGKYVGLNIINDYELYLKSLDLSRNGSKFNNLKDVGQLIRTFTALNGIPSTFEQEIEIVNKHNKFFLKKDGTKDKSRDSLKRKALYNFVSIKTKNISKDPINLIQGQSGIDVATEKVKALVKPGGKYGRLSSIAESADNRSVLSRMKQLVLTLTGKENVGIVASAMKVFEAMSHHYYKVLATGTKEEQQRLLSKITILGKKYQLIANSFVKNPDTILDENVEGAIKEVNNFQDAFIMMSALLSLATDNAKDPTLSKLNATPQTIGCYTAGLVLGLNIEEVADLLVSDTGLLLTKLLRNNVFNSKQNRFKRLSDVIRFLRNTPELPEILTEGHVLDKYFDLFGLKLDENGKLAKEPGNTLWSEQGRQKFKQLAMYLLHPDRVQLETDTNKIARKNLKDIKNDHHYYGWNDEKYQKYLKSTGEERENLEEQYKEYTRLSELKKSYEAYLEDPESIEANQAVTEINAQVNLATTLSSDTNKAQLKNLNNSNLGYKESLQSIFEWIQYREIIESDFIEIDGIKHSRLENIRKLNSFNEEMGDLRTILKLNQGLPNSVQEQLSWINTFKGILQRAARRQNRSVKKDSDTPLSKFNQKYGSLDLDLNMFLNNQEYQQDAIKAYESTKVGVNILDVVLNVPHYTGYLKTMNLLYEGGKMVSKNYSTQAYLTKTIMPLLNLKTQEQIEQFFKTLKPVIFERVNTMFIQQEQAQFEIPKFKIEKGELKEITDENGNLQFEVITLGPKEVNDHFKDYCIHYVYPYLTANYPDNAFVKAITLRTYGYNLDHKISNNIAKRESYNMTNPLSNTKFNEIKKALGELNGISGLIKTLFYYNLLAYNNQPGAQALTDLFEDFLVYDTNDSIKKYNTFITYLDESDVVLFDENDTDYLLRTLAPKVFPTDDVDNMPYIWITNPENNEDILLQAVGEMTDEEREQLAAIEENSGENYQEESNDDDYSEYSKYNSYKTLNDVLKYQLLNKYTEAEEYKEKALNKRFLLGKNVLLNTNSLFDILFDHIQVNKENKKRGFSKISFISSLSDDQKNKILKERSKDILLFVNDKQMTLEELLNLAQINGWSEQEVLNGFRFVLRKSKDHKYDELVTSTLKSTLDLVTKQKDCNG